MQGLGRGGDPQGGRGDRGSGQVGRGRGGRTDENHQAGLAHRRHDAAVVGRGQGVHAGRGRGLPAARQHQAGGRGVGRGASGPEERLSAEEILRPGDLRHEAAGLGRGGLAVRGRGAGGREERATRARAWQFTINNYQDVPRELPPNARYLCFGREVSSTGTKHIQGYVVFKYAVKKPSRFFENCGRGHFQVAKGSADENAEYCEKDGDFVEYGERPQNKADQGHHGSKGGSVEVKRWDDAWNSAKEGKIEEIPGDIRFRFYSTITKIAAKYAKPPPELEKLNNTWIVGPSGTGKSTYIHRKYPGAYKKDFSRWWDGYQEDNEAHLTVLLDDLHPKWSEKERLKNWADVFPFQAEFKGGCMLIRPARIVVTSNYTPQQVRTVNHFQFCLQISGFLAYEVIF